MRLVAPHILPFAAFLLFAAPLGADEDGNPSIDEPRAAEIPADPDQVIATVNGEEVTLRDLIALRAELPAQYQSIADDMLYTGLLEQITSQILLRQAAENAGLPERPEIRRGLAIQRTSFLAELFVRDRLNEAITPEAVEAA
ncbi:MAG: hypothetical protein ACK5MQ_12295 [Pikeienuella sp.]